MEFLEPNLKKFERQERDYTFYLNMKTLFFKLQTHYYTEIRSK